MKYKPHPLLNNKPNSPFKMLGMGGGDGGKSEPAPIPSSPTRWLYDRNGDAVQLQEYGHYERNSDIVKRPPMGNGRQSGAAGSTTPPSPSSIVNAGRASNGDPNSFSLIYDNPALASGLYLSPERAAEKNPKVWLYDDQGKTIKQVFKGGEGPDDSYDSVKYNLGPDAIPYRHWYDIYGISQEYAPVSTTMPENYWESPNKAPKSSVFQAPTSFDQVDSSMNIQPAGNTSNQDLEAVKNQSKKRRKTTQTKQLTLLGDSGTMGGSDDGSKTLLGE